MKSKITKILAVAALVSAGLVLSGCQPEHVAAFNQGFQMGSQMGSGNYHYGGY